ncbi:MAG: DUF1631 domain-containing protein [Pseudoxanthomonas sp.]
MLAAADLPARVRGILETYRSQMIGELGLRVNNTLVELEQQLFRRAEIATSNESQAQRMLTLHVLRRQRGDLLPRMLEILETQLAQVRRPPPKPQEDRVRIAYNDLSLVEDAAMDRELALREIVRRHETRSHTALYLLGQRFGVLAGAPAFDAAHIPAGPQSLCHALRDAAGVLQLDAESQLLLYRVFDHRALANYGHWLEALNDLLADAGVLPGLVFLPARVQRTQRAAGQTAAPAAATVPTALLQTMAMQPLTGWQGQSPPSVWAALFTAPDTPATANAAPPASGDAAAFAGLRQLLSGHRERAAAADPGVRKVRSGGTPMPTSQAISVLRALQAQPVHTAPGIPHRTIEDVRELLLAQARERHGPDAQLAPQDDDSFELLGMLYSEIQREVKRDAPATELLVKLQAPMAQAALRDNSFFVRPQHPARELLNSVAESGANWLDEDSSDPQLVQRLRQSVDHVVTHYDGDEGVFEQANRDVQGHYQIAARKAEMTERRHIEAARGRERLETAKLRAAETIGAAFKQRKTPKFVQALLKQSWADVLTLTLLRNGAESSQWQDALHVTEQIAVATSGNGTADDGLAARIETALAQVGYHEDEAAAIARRLSRSGEEEGDTSRTELTAKLKARARLGEQNEETRRKQLPPRTPREQECHDYLRTLPFGTWFEFTRNQQGDVVRQRLSWYSTITDRALFVNVRGQPVGEHSLDSVARLMAQRQARVVTEDRGRLIDRAWQATLGALRSLTGGRP